MVKYGWSERKAKQWDNELKPFVIRKDEILIERNRFTWSQRVIMPSKLQSSILKQLHGTALASFELNIYKIEDGSKFRKHCMQVKDNPRKVLLAIWLYSKNAWYRVYVEFAAIFLNNTYFLLIDAYSKWPKIFIMRSMTAQATINVFKKKFSAQGLPKIVVTDGGP